MTKFRLIALAALLLLPLAACSSSPVTESYPRLAFATPPAPLYEEPEPLDNPQTEIWRPGYWDYNGVSFDWVPGRIMEKPSPYAVWSADRWERRAYGWCFIPGYWI